MRKCSTNELPTLPSRTEGGLKPALKNFLGRSEGGSSVSKAITQSEAKRWRKRALAAEKMLEDQRRSWAEEWPNGTPIAAIELPPDIYGAIRTARKLKHAVVVSDVSAATNRAVFFGLPLP
jgi:hypothetical protein